jgi:hypothetical protein
MQFSSDPVHPGITTRNNDDMEVTLCKSIDDLFFVIVFSAVRG